MSASSTSLARLLLYVDPLPQGQFPIYEMDSYSKGYFMMQDNVPMVIQNVSDIFVATSEIVVQYKSINETFREALNRKEDIELFKLLNVALLEQHKIRSSKVDLNSIIDGMTKIEEHDLEVAAIVCSPTIFRRLSLIEHKQLFINRMGKRKKNGVVCGGTFFDIPIYVSSCASRNMMYILPGPKYVGVLPIRYEMMIVKVEDIPVQNKKITTKSSEGLSQIFHHINSKPPEEIAFEEIGMAILNDYLVAGIIFDLNQKKIENVVENSEKSAE